MKTILSIILLSVFCSCTLDQSNNTDDNILIDSKPEINKVISKESDRFEIHTSNIQGSDNVIEYKFFLIDNKLNDSISFLKSQRRDLPAPNYFWTSNQKLLIFEQDENYGRQSIIKFLNPENKQITYETKGFFQGQPNQHNNFLDEKNNILFCFDLTGTGQKIVIKKIDLVTLSDSVIFEFSCFDIIERPTLNINQIIRTLSYSYSCQETNEAEMTTEKGEIKY